MTWTNDGRVKCARRTRLSRHVCDTQMAASTVDRVVCKTRFKITPAKCSFEGSFVHENDQGIAAPEKTAYQGVVYQKGPEAGAYGYFLTRKPATLDYTGESGAVVISGDPAP